MNVTNKDTVYKNKVIARLNLFALPEETIEKAIKLEGNDECTQ